MFFSPKEPKYGSGYESRIYVNQRYLLLLFLISLDFWTTVQVYAKPKTKFTLICDLCWLSRNLAVFYICRNPCMAEVRGTSRLSEQENTISISSYTINLTSTCAAHRSRKSLMYVCVYHFFMLYTNQRYKNSFMMHELPCDSRKS